MSDRSAEIREEKLKSEIRRNKRLAEERRKRTMRCYLIVLIINTAIIFTVSLLLGILIGRTLWEVL